MIEATLASTGLHSCLSIPCLLTYVCFFQFGRSLVSWVWPRRCPILRSQIALAAFGGIKIGPHILRLITMAYEDPHESEEDIEEVRIVLKASFQLLVIIDPLLPCTEDPPSQIQARAKGLEDRFEKQLASNQQEVKSYHEPS